MFTSAPLMSNKVLINVDTLPGKIIIYMFLRAQRRKTLYLIFFFFIQFQTRHLQYYNLKYFIK